MWHFVIISKELVFVVIIVSNFIKSDKNIIYV